MKTYNSAIWFEKKELSYASNYFYVWVIRLALNLIYRFFSLPQLYYLMMHKFELYSL